MVGGDFNAVINPALDKSQSDTTASPSSKLLNKFITELNLIDLWRIQNTKAKVFTFFLIDTRTFSRIDYIFPSSLYYQFYYLIILLCCAVFLFPMLKPSPLDGALTYHY